jgi:hypothetical protein
LHLAVAEGRRVPGALAVAAEVEGQHVEAEVVQRLQQPGDVVAVAAVAVAEQHVAPRAGVGDQPAAQLQRVGRAEVDVLERHAERGGGPLGHRVQRVQGHDDGDEQGRQGGQGEPGPAGPCRRKVTTQTARPQQAASPTGTTSGRSRKKATVPPRKEPARSTTSLSQATAGQGRSPNA